MARLMAAVLLALCGAAHADPVDNAVGECMNAEVAAGNGSSTMRLVTSCEKIVTPWVNQCEKDTNGGGFCVQAAKLAARTVIDRRGLSNARGRAGRRSEQSDIRQGGDAAAVHASAWASPICRASRQLDDASTARDSRLKVERLGIRTYTQAAQTPDGGRIRVRIGPFVSREDVETAARKVI